MTRENRTIRRLACLATLLLTLATARAATAQAPGPPPDPQGGREAAALARQLSNPVASLVSVPFQLNFDQRVGPDDDQRFVMNFQPVMPFSLNKDWNVVARVIVPVVSQPSLAPGLAPTSGLGDITSSFFFSPVRSKVFWGVGPALQLPISADPTLGTAKWAAGPTVVVLKQNGRWTAGMLANHLWSYAGDSDRPAVNQTFLQPFFSCGTRTGFTFTLATETSASWEAEAGRRWTVPILFGVSKVTRLGRRPLSVGVSGGYFAAVADGGPDWRIRTTLTLIFPR
jgi:hypothetical protein